jgi:putative tryptophan/tyrosine transport system substrate-binding protein
MKRREFVAVVAGVATSWSLEALAQTSKQLRIGINSVNPSTSPIWVAFLQRMRELGHIEGQNFAIEFILAVGPDSYLEGMKELVRRKVDILVATGNEVALRSALAATNTLPIVMIAIDYDPLALGYVSNLARPTGNVTGVFFQQIELSMKRLQILKEAFPRMKAAAVMWDQTAVDQWHASQRAAAMLGIQLFDIELSKHSYDYGQAMSQLVSDDRNPLFVVMSGFFFRDRDRLASFALEHRLASFFGTREFVDAGGLMSYGPSILGLFRQAAEYVDKIGHGAKPADLPVQQPTKFELVVNLKTAKTIGIEIPQSILLRADEVIE